MNYTVSELDRKLYAEADLAGLRQLSLLISEAPWHASDEVLIDLYPIARMLHQDELWRLMDGTD